MGVYFGASSLKFGALAAVTGNPMTRLPAVILGVRSRRRPRS